MQTEGGNIVGVFFKNFIKHNNTLKLLCTQTKNWSWISWISFYSPRRDSDSVGDQSVLDIWKFNSSALCVFLYKI